MQIIKRDNNELRYNAIWLLDKQGNPDYYKQLIRNTKAFFFGMKKPELNKELDKLIHNKLERKLGTDIQTILYTYKNLPNLNSFTRSKKAGENEKNIYKYTIEKWFDEIEEWIFQKAITLEQDIIFSSPPKQYI